MIIERIKIRSFGNLSNVKLELGQGINILVGENESGKSMVAAFIRYMLYGFSTHHAPNDLPEREKRVSWKTGTAEGEMDIALSDGRRLRIVRRTEAIEQGGRVSYREEAGLIDLADGSATGFRALPGDAFFKVPEQVYAATAFFGQCSGSRFNESEMTQAMENLLFSGDERVNTQRAVKTMREARNSLSHPSGVGGAIYELNAQTDTIRARLTQAMRSSARILKTETELHSLREKITAAEAERDRLSEVETFYRGYLTICSFDKLHEVESEHAALVSARETLRRESGSESFLPDEDYLTSLKTAERVAEIARRNYLRTVEKLESVQADAVITPEARELYRKTEEAGGRSAVEEEYSRLHRTSRRHYSVGWVLLVLALLLLGAAALYLRPLTLSPTTALPALGILMLMIVSIHSFRRGAATFRKILKLWDHFGVASGADLLCCMNGVEQTARIMEEGVENIRRAEENSDISRENLETVRSELLSLAVKWDKEYTLGAPEAPIAKLSERVQDFFREDHRLSDEIATVRKRMLELREELSGESEITVRAQVPPSRREAMKKINHKTIQEGLSYYRSTCENLHTQYTALLAELNEYRREAENPALLRTELAAMEERVADLRRRYRAYGIATDAIESASDRLRAEISPRLSEVSGKLLSVATGGRYPALEVSNRLLMTYRDGEGNARPIPGISGSTCEVAYIALRLALIDMLYKEMPPLCFDESLAHQDDGRTKNMMKMLDSVAASGMQSILLTCHRRDARLASQVVENVRCLTI